jgi:GMP synthase (glutamine-hydrolysing)
MYIYLCIYTHTFIRIGYPVYIYIYIYTYTHTHTYAYIRTFIQYTYVYIRNMHAYIHTYIVHAGYQLLNYCEGGKVEKASKREDLQETIQIDNTGSLLFSGLKKEEAALLTHGDAVKEIAPGFRASAWSHGLVVGIENAERRLYGTQFHPEVDLTTNGRAMIRNFLVNICDMKPSFTPQSRHQAALDEIRATVGEKEILVLVSGGVDSSVCAALCREAVGPSRVRAVHIDHGFMRKDESSTVQKALGKVGINLHMVHCGPEFAAARTTSPKGATMGPLVECTAPEEKRMIIGDTFMRVTEETVRKLGISADKVFLAQGTLRPDLIESGSHLASAKADVIKTHHNDTALVRELRAQGKIVEPLRDFHKDEVRELGEALGLPKHLVWRQPFPGPGLAIRVLCSDGTPALPPQASDIEKIKGLVKKHASLAYSVVQLPVLTVGVQGDCRSYKAAVALSLPAGTDPAKIKWKELFEIAKYVPAEVPSVSRTCFMFGAPMDSDSPGTNSTKKKKSLYNDLI